MKESRVERACLNLQLVGEGEHRGPTHDGGLRHEQIGRDVPTIPDMTCRKRLQLCLTTVLHIIIRLRLSFLMRGRNLDCPAISGGGCSPSPPGALRGGAGWLVIHSDPGSFGDRPAPRHVA